jgi:outer membrane protein assembly factor BamB
MNKFLSILLLIAAMPSLTATATVAAEKASQVLRFTIPELVEEKHNVVVTLYHRDGKFQLGYAQLPGRDNIVHRIDVTPSAAIAFIDEKGKKLVVPKEASHYYSYMNRIKNPFFRNSRTAFYEGKLKITHTSKVPSLQWKGRQLAGLIDLKINRFNEVNRIDAKHSQFLYRLNIKAEVKNGVLSGKATAWQYETKDPDYGKDSKKTSYAIAGKLVSDHWKAKAGTEYAKGKNWPMAHGPNLTGAAIDCDTSLVESLHDARLVWVADMPLGAGRGGGLMRGNFCMYPINWTVSHEGGYGGPIMADDKVFVSVPSRDIEELSKHPELNRNPYYRLGADPGLATVRVRVPPKDKLTELFLPRDSLFAFDARTGKLLWQYHGEPGTIGNGGKGGKASTPCYYKGKIYLRTGHSVICFDSDTGEQLWVNTDYGLKNAPSDASITLIGGSLVLTHPIEEGWATVGLSPKDGKKIWSIDFAGGGGAGHGYPGMGIPGLYRDPSTGSGQGKEYLVLGRSRPFEKREDKSSVPPENFIMVDPTDGRILWESDALRYNDGQIVVMGDIAIGNVTPYNAEVADDKAEDHRIGGVRISTKGAKRIWASDIVQPASKRKMSIAYNGVYYGDSRTSDFTATDIATGKLLKRYPGIYDMSQVSHNWSWQIASNDRIITEGINMFKIVENGMRRSFDRLGNSVAGGYLSPTKPAIADGRLIFRMDDKLVCFDLRAEKGSTSKPVAKSKEASSPSKDPGVLLKDDFNRADADSAGRGWTNKGSTKAIIKDNALFFEMDDSYFEPHIVHAFPVQKKGKIRVSYLMDWLRKAEGTWSLSMQLGNSKEIPETIGVESNLAKGIAVNLQWGGGDQIGDPGTLGYVKDGEFRKLVVVNDAETPGSVVEKPKVTIQVDVDASTYGVTLNGKTYADLPFDNKGPIDTIRFIAHSCGNEGLPRSSIDDVVITTGQ